MATGPGEIFCQTERSLELANFFEGLIDKKLRALKDWDGGSSVRLLISYVKPNMAVQAELRRRYTKGEDGWSDVIFEPALTGGFWLTLKP